MLVFGCQYLRYWLQHSGPLQWLGLGSLPGTGAAGPGVDVGSSASWTMGVVCLLDLSDLSSRFWFFWLGTSLRGLRPAYV